MLINGIIGIFLFKRKNSTLKMHDHRFGSHTQNTTRVIYFSRYFRYSLSLYPCVVFLFCMFVRTFVRFVYAVNMWIVWTLCESHRLRKTCVCAKNIDRNLFVSHICKATTNGQFLHYSTTNTSNNKLNDRKSSRNAVFTSYGKRNVLYVPSKQVHGETLKSRAVV